MGVVTALPPACRQGDRPRSSVAEVAGVRLAVRRGVDGQEEGRPRRVGSPRGGDGACLARGQREPHPAGLPTSGASPEQPRRRADSLARRGPDDQNVGHDSGPVDRRQDVDAVARGESPRDRGVGHRQPDRHRARRLTRERRARPHVVHRQHLALGQDGGDGPADDGRRIGHRRAGHGSGGQLANVDVARGHDRSHGQLARRHEHGQVARCGPGLHGIPQTCDGHADEQRGERPAQGGATRGAQRRPGTGGVAAWEEHGRDARRPACAVSAAQAAPVEDVEEEVDDVDDDEEELDEEPVPLDDEPVPLEDAELVVVDVVVLDPDPRESVR